MQCLNLTSNTQVNNLVVLSDKNCGYCKIALSELQFFRNNNKIKINVIEFGNGDTEKLIKTYPEYNFIDPNKCNYNGKKPDFFPQFLLINKSNKLVWSKKGWFAQNLKDIEKELK